MNLLKSKKIIYENNKDLNIELITKKLNIDWKKNKFTPEDLLDGINVESEHGSHDSQTDVTNGTDDPIIFAKIALAHLKEKPNYYKLLKTIES